VAIDPVTRSVLDVVDHRRKPGVLDVGRLAAAGAHDVVVVARLARDIRVFAAREVDPFDGAELHEDVQRAKDGRPADPEALHARVGQELRGGEMAVTCRDHVRQGAARPGQPVAGGAKGKFGRWASAHEPDDTESQPLCRDSVSTMLAEPPVLPQTGTIVTLPRRSVVGQTPGAMTLEPIAIPQADANIYNCPVCARPLATTAGMLRCPGCNTRLILATPISRAAVFVAAGLAAGLLFAFLFSAVAGAMSAPRTGGPGASAAPGSGNVGGGGRPSAAPSIAPASRAALGQVAALDARLAAVAGPLRVALKAKDLDSAAVADLLRSLAADAAYGDDLASRVGTWDQAYALSLDLSNQFGSIRSTAREGLAASITNDPAYRATAQKMLAVLAGIAPLDKRLRELAKVADVALPGGSPNAAPG
jgi:hypothetical protein